MEEKEESVGCFAGDLLLCDEEPESLTFCSGESETEQQLIGLPSMSDECFWWMVEREKEYLPRDGYIERLRTGEIDLSLRREAFDWMSKACVHHCFGEVCLYSAMNYFDRFLSVYDLPDGKTWAAHLVAVACLFLAAKMDEVHVPNSVDLQCGVLHTTGESRLLFEARTVHRMEMILLNALNWNLKPYTASHFIEYFLWKMSHKKLPQEQWISRSIHMIPSIHKGIDFLEFRPSEIAAAVAIYISGEREVAMAVSDKALPCFIGVEKGKVMKCLKLIQDSISTHSIASGSLFSVTNSPNGVLETVFWSYRSDENVYQWSPSSVENTPTPAKRRRLDMNQFREDDP